MKPTPAPPPSARYAVVSAPGTLFEKVESYHSTYKIALEWAADYREDGLEVDVMAVLPSGNLTTEF
jgi:hypothetical protein